MSTLLTGAQAPDKIQVMPWLLTAEAETRFPRRHENAR
jgi:hypothetical protein